MPKATWNGTVIAESDETQVIEGNHYFPPAAIKRDYFKPSSHRTICPWKGEASYYDVEVDGVVNQNAAWCYPSASDRAKSFEGWVAFWNGVIVEA